MKFEPQDPPRTFRVGNRQSVEITDCGRVYLEPDEQVTFVSEAGREYDFVAKSWGFYATPSINGRLREQGFKTALVRNAAGRLYIMVVDKTHLNDFEAYCRTEQQKVEAWLDER